MGDKVSSTRPIRRLPLVFAVVAVVMAILYLHDATTDDESFRRVVIGFTWTVLAIGSSVIGLAGPRKKTNRTRGSDPPGKAKN